MKVSKKLNIKYQIPTLDAAGNPTGGYKAQPFTKTVYDPKVISDAQMAEWGKQAAQEAISAGRIGPNGRVWEGFSQWVEVLEGILKQMVL